MELQTEGIKKDRDHADIREGNGRIGMKRGKYGRR